MCVTAFSILLEPGAAKQHQTASTKDFQFIFSRLLYRRPANLKKRLFLDDSLSPSITLVIPNRDSKQVSHDGSRYESFGRVFLPVSFSYKDGVRTFNEWWKLPASQTSAYNFIARWFTLHTTFCTIFTNHCWDQYIESMKY